MLPPLASVSYILGTVIQHHPKSQTRTPWRFFLGLLCLALVVFGSTVQVAHNHPGGDISHADCSLCLTAHVVAQVVSNPVPIPAVLVLAAVEETLPQPKTHTLSVFALFTRPPPAPSNFS